MNLKHTSTKPNKLVMSVVSGPGIKELDSTTHSTVSDDQYQTTLQFSYLQQELAADSVGKGNNCIISIVGKIL